MASSALAVRAFKPTVDFTLLLQLLSEVEDFDQDGEDVSEATQRAYLALPGHDPEQDRWVIEDPDRPDRLIGFGSTWARMVWNNTYERAESYLAVRPNARRRRLGTTLLNQITQRARELGANHLVIHANERNLGSNAFLLKHNFEPVGSYWLLVTQLGDLIEEPRCPAGYTIRSYAAVRDRRAVVRAMESYRDQWGHYGPRPGEEPVPWLSRVDPAGVFLAFGPSGEPVGICVAVQRANSGVPTIESAGHINGPGVMPNHRAQGLHQFLTLTALCWHQAQGRKTISMDSWGDDESTLEIYQRCGFIPVQHLISYQHLIQSVTAE